MWVDGLSPIQLGMRCKEALRLSQAEPGAAPQAPFSFGVIRRPFVAVAAPVDDAFSP